MFAWQFAKALATSERHGWTRFSTMQNHLNLINREEEREMLPLCADAGHRRHPVEPARARSADARLGRDQRAPGDRRVRPHAVHAAHRGRRPQGRRGGRRRWPRRAACRGRRSRWRGSCSRRRSRRRSSARRRCSTSTTRSRRWHVDADRRRGRDARERRTSRTTSRDSSNARYLSSALEQGLVEARRVPGSAARGRDPRTRSACLAGSRAITCLPSVS